MTRSVVVLADRIARGSQGLDLGRPERKREDAELMPPARREDFVEKRQLADPFLQGPFWV